MRTLTPLTTRRFSMKTSVRFRFSFIAVICSTSSSASMSWAASGMSRFTYSMYSSSEISSHPILPSRLPQFFPLALMCDRAACVPQAANHKHKRRRRMIRAFVDKGWAEEQKTYLCIFASRSFYKYGYHLWRVSSGAIMVPSWCHHDMIHVSNSGSIAEAGSPVAQWRLSWLARFL